MINTTNGYTLSGLFFNDVISVPIISYNLPFNQEKLNLFEPMHDLPLCQTLECAIDVLKNHD